jgi:diguanylate cyclase (GGDEF)-like protein
MQILDEESSAYSADFFLFRLQQELSRTRRTGAPLCVALINVNHFAVLDQADVLARRDAITRVAGLLGSHLRPEDMSARIDGDRFALLLCDINERDAQRMIEGLRVLVNSVVVGADRSGEALRARAAAGVVEYDGQGLSVEDVLGRARIALEGAESVPAGSTQPYSGLSPAWPPERRELTGAPAEVE